MHATTHHCGLDFGTSNSTLGIAHGERAKLLPLEAGRTIIPSTVFFDFDTDAVLFGRTAIAEYIGGASGRMMRSLKSILGSSLADEVTRIKRRVLPFVDVVGIFIAALRERAESGIGNDLDSVVVGRPVHFVDEDPLADRNAQSQLEGVVRAQGFRHVEFEYEPIAAALDYEQRVSREELALVIDLGGGTSDFSIIRVSPDGGRKADRREDILAAAGVHVGGTDFDRLLSLRTVMPELGYQTPTADMKRPLPSAPYVELATWHRINRLYTPEVLRELRHTRREARDPERVAAMISIVAHHEGHRLAGAVEEAKIALTDADETTLGFEGTEIKLTPRISRGELGAAIASRIAKIEIPSGGRCRLPGWAPSGSRPRY